MIAINVDKIMLLFFVISWIIIHLGKNPESGGRSPNANIIRRMNMVIKIFYFILWEQ